MLELPHIPYNLKSGPPWNTRIDMLTRQLPFSKEYGGINCRLYTSLLVRALGFYVPDEYSSRDWFDDPENKLDIVNCATESIQDGDVLGFSRPNETDMIHLHVGVARVRPDGEVDILHASRKAGRVIVTPLHEMHFDPRHAQLYMIRRPKVKKPRNFHALYALGWFATWY